MADNAASVGGGESSIRWTLRRHLEGVRPLSQYRKTRWRCCPGDKEGADYDDKFFLFLSAFQQRVTLRSSLKLLSYIKVGFLPI